MTTISSTTSSAQPASTEPRTPVLEVSDLNVDFGVDNEWVPAARHMSYRIMPGEVLALVGESGSGKSASSMALLDLLPSNSRIRGSIKLNGEEITGIRANQMRRIRGGEIAVILH